MKFGRLKLRPIICHNSPTTEYFSNLSSERDVTLRKLLQNQGAPLKEVGGCILLRAGAIGEYGGIEETIFCMKNLPQDYVFLMMGRPPQAYKEKIERLIQAENLNHRIFLWNRPSDNMWKMALAGADIGHLIHGPFITASQKRQYDFNSSLSNNRLFQYMAASIPILSYDDPRMSYIHNEVGCFRVARLSNLAEDIENIWRELGSDSALRKRVGSNGRKAHLNKYCWEIDFSPILNNILLSNNN